MDYKQLQKIIKIFEESSVTYMDLEVDDIKIKLDKRDNKVQQMPIFPQNIEKTEAKSEDVKEEVQGEIVKSPLVGTFHQAQSQGQAPYVTLGSKVKAGQTLCIIEAMKVMNEIKAPNNGVIKEISVKEGQIVEFGTKLFVIGE